MVPKARWSRVVPPSAHTVTAAVVHNGAKHDPYEDAGAFNINTACVPRTVLPCAGVATPLDLASLEAVPAAAPAPAAAVARVAEADASPREKWLAATRNRGRTSRAPSMAGSSARRPSVVCVHESVAAAAAAAAPDDPSPKGGMFDVVRTDRVFPLSSAGMCVDRSSICQCMQFLNRVQSKCATCMCVFTPYTTARSVRMFTR